MMAIICVATAKKVLDRPPLKHHDLLNPHELGSKFRCRNPRVEEKEVDTIGTLTARIHSALS